MADAEVLDFVVPEVIRPWSYRCKMPIERITRNHKAQILSKTTSCESLVRQGKGAERKSSADSERKGWCAIISGSVVRFRVPREPERPQTLRGERETSMALASEAAPQALRLSEQEIVQRDWTRIRFGLAIGIMAAGLGAATTILNLYTEFEGIGALERVPPGQAVLFGIAGAFGGFLVGGPASYWLYGVRPTFSSARTARAKAVGVAPTGRRVRVLLLLPDGGYFPPDRAGLIPLSVERHVRPQRGGKFLQPVHRIMVRLWPQERVPPPGGVPVLGCDGRGGIWALCLGDR